MKISTLTSFADKLWFGEDSKGNVDYLLQKSLWVLLPVELLQQQNLYSRSSKRRLQHLEEHSVVPSYHKKMKQDSHKVESKPALRQ